MSGIVDLEYTQDTMFTRFYPNTVEGEDAWRTMAGDDAAVIFNHHAKAVIKQLRDAGYSVAKAKKSRVSLERILAELEA